MKDWQPVAELERLLDALESELLSAGDEEIREALGRRQPANAVIEAVADAVPRLETVVWTRHATGRRMFGWPMPAESRTRDN
jgi:hypothetical protein